MNQSPIGMVPAIGFRPDSSPGFLQPCSDGNRDSLAFIVDSGEHRRAEGKVDGPTTAELKARTIESALGDPLRKWAALKREPDKG